MSTNKTCAISSRKSGLVSAGIVFVTHKVRKSYLTSMVRARDGKQIVASPDRLRRVRAMGVMGQISDVRRWLHELDGCAIRVANIDHALSGVRARFERLRL